MTNKEYATFFNELAGLMELHGENPFKVRSYQNAYLVLRKLPTPVESLSVEELQNIKGIGKAISEKIAEIRETGKLKTLESFRSMTPEGIRELISIKGIGPKKVRLIWDQLGIESPGELLYACYENRLVDLKGFGEKTQKDYAEKLEYFLDTRDSFLLASLDDPGKDLLERLRAEFPDQRFEPTGAWRRKCNTLENVEIITDAPKEMLETSEGLFDDTFPVEIHYVETGEFEEMWFRTTGSEGFLAGLNEEKRSQCLEKDHPAPEMREKSWLDREDWPKSSQLIEEKDLLGLVHMHTDYSDGINTLEEMAEAAKSRGFLYMVVTDHSRSAFYANGLEIERLIRQMEEIDKLNDHMQDFRILKGIESDILNDGNLDYPDEILSQLDLVIASVHSNLKMDEKKAMDRLIKAVENPHTGMLGHPTGRLLLSRAGYPVDHEKLIDACAANGVSIEINANPYRLDLDWHWIPYAIEKGVKLSINPDAHSTKGIRDVRFGVYTARKGGLTAEHCANALDAVAFAALFANR